MGYTSRFGRGQAQFALGADTVELRHFHAPFAVGDPERAVVEFLKHARGMHQRGIFLGVSGCVFHKLASFGRAVPRRFALCLARALFA
jgi:hypothetical protein